VWHGEAGVTDDVVVQVRAHGGLAPARVTVTDDGLEATLGEPLRGVSPGQAVVVYSGDRVLGSATITATA
jgi:tRNA-specific 2-thiouridylase